MTIFAVHPWKEWNRTAESGFKILWSSVFQTSWNHGTLLYHCYCCLWLHGLWELIQSEATQPRNGGTLPPGPFHHYPDLFAEPLMTYLGILLLCRTVWKPLLQGNTVIVLQQGPSCLCSSVRPHTTLLSSWIPWLTPVSPRSASGDPYSSSDLCYPPCLLQVLLQFFFFHGIVSIPETGCFSGPRIYMHTQY